MNLPLNVPPQNPKESLDKLQHILNYISSDEVFSKKLVEKYSALEADVTSFRLNPNCSCKSRIRKFLTDNKDTLEFFDNWVKENNIKLPEIKPPGPSPEMIKQQEEKKRTVLKTSLPQQEWKNYKDVIGEVVEIEPDPNKYKQLITIAREKWLYNGLNVIETAKKDSEGNDKIVWLVFFH
jgi:hypothetical protein